MRRRSFLTLAQVALAAPWLMAATGGGDEEEVGEVVDLVGSAVALKDAMPRVLKVGAKIQLGDVVSTAKESRIALRMIDDAEFSLGERSNFVVEEYVLKAGGKDGGAGVRLLEGAVRAVSGKIAQLDNHPFELRTPVATIGVRGTEFWGGMLDGVHQFALLSSSGTSITVTNRSGTTVIDRANEGVEVRSNDAKFEPPHSWGADKLARAAAITRVR
jgi:hypothetical protein